MKVSGTGSSKGTSKSEKAKQSVSPEQAREFSNLMAASSAEEPQGAAGVGAASSIVQVDALLMAQAAEDATQGQSKQRMQKRAHKILDVLDDLRMKMLGGQLTVGDMIDMADVVASHREAVSDPTLTALMDEVDLRAQVELAKMRVVLDRENAHN